jgi:hypothetical protein
MRIILTLLAFQLIASISLAQDFKLSVTGTSTFHEWEMKTTKIACNAGFSFYDDGTLARLTALNFILPADGLKGDRTGMDNNAYMALKVTQYPTISFVMSNATVSPDGDSIDCTGALTVSGVTKTITFHASVTVKNKDVHVKGSKDLNMRDFDIDPPSFLMGTFKTGEEITVSFDMLFKHP